MVIGAVLTDDLLIALPVIHLLKLDQHLRSSLYVFFELRYLHVFG